MRSFIDDLPMTKTFDNLELKNDKDIVVTFQVPPNLESIEITASGDVTNITKGTCEKKTYTNRIAISTYKSTTRYFETYLRRINKEYYFYLYGKAGEPVCDADVDKIILNPLVTKKKEYNEEFSTDKEGKVKLGQLGEICWISIQGKKDEKSFNCIFNLPYEDEQFHYPNDMQYLEGEQVILPYPHSLFNSGSLSLLRVGYNNNYIKNCFENIEYKRKEGHDYGDIILNDLESGKLALILL